MELRVPSGGSLIDVLQRSGATAATDLSSADASLPDVTPAQLDEAIAALERGEIEYLALHEAGTFLQVAGEGRGPYLIELNPGDLAGQVHVPAGVTDEAMRYGLHAFLAHDPAWAQPFPWESAGLGELRPDGHDGRGGAFKRLFGRR